MVKSTVIPVLNSQCESLGSFLDVEEKADDEEMTDIEDENTDKYWPWGKADVSECYAADLCRNSMSCHEKLPCAAESFMTGMVNVTRLPRRAFEHRSCIQLMSMSEEAAVYSG